MVSRIEGCDGQRAIGLNCADGSLIDKNRSSGSATLDGQCGHARLRLGVWARLRLQAEDQFGVFTLADGDLLLGRILKAVLGDLYNVILELEIRQAQLAASSELRLKFSVEKNFGVVLTCNDKESACIATGFYVTGVGGRLITGSDFSGRGIGRNSYSRRRRFWS